MVSLRIGLMGTAGIASKNFFAMLGSDKCQFVAVGSRTKERAEEWARVHVAKAVEEGHKIGVDAITCHGSYEDLLADKNVDAIYCPLPTALHSEWAPKIAAAGKGMLVEKPVALSTLEYKAIAEEFRSRSLPLMDGVMFMHHERMGAIKQIMEAAAGSGGLAGGATRISSGFSFPAGDEFLRSNIRTDPDLDALGALGDLGWYQVRFAQWAFGWDPPSTVRALCNRHVARGKPPATVTPAAGPSAAGVAAGGGGDAPVPWTASGGTLPSSGAVPTDVTCTLEWSDGRVASFDCSFHHAFRQWLEISGMDGALSMDDFVIARGPAGVDLTMRREASPVKDHREVVAETTTTTVGTGCVQESKMFDAFAGVAAACQTCRESGAPDWPSAFWAEASLATQTIMDAAMVSMRAGGAPQDLSRAVKRPSIPSEDAAAGSWPWLGGPSSKVFA